MNLFEKFSAALPLSDFLTKHGIPAHKERWDRTFNQIALTEDQKNLLKQFKRETPVLVLAGAWCGDCSGQCPAFERFAEIAPCLKIRYLDRDVHADVQAALKINGGNRVPVAVFFSEDGMEVSRYGERTLSQYRRMVEQQTGEACGSGIVGKDALAQIVQEWLNEFERVQWILRLSPRLRTKHGD
ncbi:thioredoxin family protein [Telmatocola sphagniphila]|uniref:Thioredoxin family protein n=1 Tax=Telmatocola sphagniphila TaxID=1123043 RepID=A0A8E6BAN7_9BACT|nr:thioredoxin family protein [Telmatocola sphagniphila]QVL33663.1 thioredoxin family protein [Telmatocola sphagniphila]